MTSFERSVHPRSRGESRHRVRANGPEHGSSPRKRERRQAVMLSSNPQAVHPRSRGQDPEPSCALDPLRWLSPARAGKMSSRHALWVNPAGRERHDRAAASLRSGRFTPAHAGKTRAPPGTLCTLPVDPRSRREDFRTARESDAIRFTPRSWGRCSPPPQRGTLYAIEHQNLRRRSSPARAGKNSALRDSRLCTRGSPPLAREKHICLLQWSRPTSDKPRSRGES